MFILRNPHRAYDTRYLLICTDDFSQKIGGKIDVHTLKQAIFCHRPVTVLCGIRYWSPYLNVTGHVSFKLLYN